MPSSNRKARTWVTTLLRSGMLLGSLLSGLLLIEPRAYAHAVLMSSVPKAGDIIGGSSITTQLRFNSRIDGKRSRLVLVYPDGKLYPLDIIPQSAPEVLNAPAHGLLPGSYKLRWQVLAADGHITRGEIQFVIR